MYCQSLSARRRYLFLHVWTYFLVQMLANHAYSWRCKTGMTLTYYSHGRRHMWAIRAEAPLGKSKLIWICSGSGQIFLFVSLKACFQTPRFKKFSACGGNQYSTRRNCYNTRCLGVSFANFFSSISEISRNLQFTLGLWQKVWLAPPWKNFWRRPWLLPYPYTYTVYSNKSLLFRQLQASFVYLMLQLQ